jgi:hypothetical protein
MKLTTWTKDSIRRDDENLYDLEIISIKMRDLDTGADLLELSLEQLEEETAIPGSTETALLNVQQQLQLQQPEQQLLHAVDNQLQQLPAQDHQQQVQNQNFQLMLQTLQSQQQQEINDSDLHDQHVTRFTLPRKILEMKTLGATLKLKVGPKKISNLRLIERHYFRSRLLKTYDFSLGCLIPSSVNTLSLVYRLPQLTRDEVKEILDDPYEARADCFFFVDDELIIHCQSAYSFGLDERVKERQQKDSERKLQNELKD